MSTKGVVFFGHPSAQEAARLRVRIEQLRARGFSVPGTAAELDVPTDLVREVWDAMDEACEVG